KDAHCAADKREAYPAAFLARAPLVVAICVERGRAHGRGRESGILAASHLLLAAHARGLGGTYLTAYQPDDPGLENEIRLLLHLPADVDPIALVPLGYPAERPTPKELRPLAELIHEEAFRGPPER
ncbi:MAG TPA: nitroreductase family protein, partial [Gemmatimonadota bacterium]|nr:nitroreductase family protein [Gemmatimonadota bacterium]